jgi:hypothetical protein
MDKQSAIYGDSLEFYHDKGGLMTSKQGILDATKHLWQSNQRTGKEVLKCILSKIMAP